MVEVLEGESFLPRNKKKSSRVYGRMDLSACWTFLVLPHHFEFYELGLMLYSAIPIHYTYSKEMFIQSMSRE